MPTVNRLRISKLGHSLRATAFVLALICLGISGGMTLSHSEDLSSLRKFPVGQSALMHSIGDGSISVTCLACEWEDSTFDPHLPTVPVLRPILTLMPLPPRHFQTHPPQSFDHTSPRAPPRDLS